MTALTSTERSRNRRERQKHSRESVLAKITLGPIRFQHLAGSAKHEHRIELRKVVDKLTEEGLIRLTYIDRFPHLVLKDWRPSDDLTLMLLEGRGRPTEEGCLLWSGYTDPMRGPMASLGEPRIPTSVRRVIWGLKRKPLDQNLTVKPTCGNWDCIAYGHMKAVKGRSEAQTGTKKTRIHAMNIANGLRKKQGKLTMEIAREARQSTLSAAKFAALHGVTKEAIAMIRRGQTWKEYGNGFFTGLIQQDVRH